MPSSLPPSSPPSASSHLPEPKVDHIFTHQPFSLPRLSTDDVFRDLPSDDELEDSGRDIIDDDDTYDNSDPFGFFALEQKLKAQRLLASNQEVRTRHRNSSHKRLDEHNIIRIEKLSEGDLSPRISSLPSTPSPSKPKPSGSRMRAKYSLHGDDSEEPGLVTHKTSNGRFGAKAADLEKGLSTPRAKTVNRKLPVRRAAATRKRHKAPDNRGDAEQDAPPSTKLKGKPTRDAKARGRRPRERVNAQQTLDCDSEEYGKRERERQARVEYFQRLQDYQLEKENVYVI